jgi:glycosyltransferase involved in cell wall biosynthesis
MSISVVIPLYNKAPYISRALSSVLRQTIQDFECIVVDDGSTDGSAHIVQAIKDPRLRLIHQSNAGVSIARNRGIAEAKGQYVALLDADDEWLPQMLQELAELVSAFPSSGLVATGYKYSDAPGICPGGKALMEEGFHRGLLTNYFNLAANAGMPFYSSSVALNKDALLTVGGFRPIWGGEDPDLWLRITVRFPVAYSTRVCAIYHRGMPSQYSNLDRIPVYPPAALSVRDLDAANLIPKDMRSDVLEYAYRLLIWHAAECNARGMRREAQEALQQCRNTKTLTILWWKEWVKALLPPFLLASIRPVCQHALL